MFSILDIKELYIILYVYQMHYNHLVCIDVECELWNYLLDSKIVQETGQNIQLQTTVHDIRNH